MTIKLVRDDFTPAMKRLAQCLGTATVRPIKSVSIASLRDKSPEEIRELLEPPVTYASVAEIARRLRAEKAAAASAGKHERVLPAVAPSCPAMTPQEAEALVRAKVKSILEGH